MRSSIATAVVVVLLAAALAGLALAGSTSSGRTAGAFASGATEVGSSSQGAVRPAALGIGSILSTIDPIANRTYSGDAGVAPELYPQYGVYDSANGQIFLRNSEDTEAAVGVLSTTTGQMVVDITTPGGSIGAVITPTIADDSKTGYLYATNANSGTYPGNVSIIDPVTDQVTGEITVGYSPDGIVYDPVDNDLYVANSGTHNVTVISGANNLTVANIQTPSDPSVMLFDPIDNQVFVANHAPTGSVTVIDATTNTAIANVTVGDYPLALALDTQDDYVDVMNESTVGGYGHVTEVHAGGSPSVVATLTVGLEPIALAYDPINDCIYVANTPSTAYDNVSVFNQSTGQEVANIFIGQGPTPQSIVFDPVGGDVYVSAYQANNVSIINPTTNKPIVSVSTYRTGGLGPLGLVVDPVTGNVYTLNEGDELTAPTSTVISPTSHLVIDTISLATNTRGITYEAASNTLAVGNAGGNNTYFFNASTYAVTHEVPAGRNPEFTAYDGATGTTYTLNPLSDNITAINAAGDPVASIPIGVGGEVQSMDFNSFNGNLYVVSEEGNVTVINGTTNTHLTPILLHAMDPWGSAYDSHNHDVYVANYESHNVSVIGPASTVIGAIPVGADPINVAFDSENNTVWVANVGSANMTVINDTTQLPVFSVPLSTNPNLLEYDPANNAIYNDPGYPYEVVAYNASTYQELAGSPVVYTTVSSTLGSMGYDPVTHDLLVADLTSGAIYVIGTPPHSAATYAVTFQESGLPNGATWYINITGQSGLQATVSGSDGTTVLISLANATYDYTATTNEPGWTTTAASGSFEVAGTTLNEPVPFTTSSIPQYQVTFTESGLPDGATWYVNITGKTGLSATVSDDGGTNFDIDLPNATYDYTAAVDESNWTTPSSGSFTVAGVAFGVAVPFTSTAVAQFAVSFTESGLPDGATWYVNITGQPGLTGTISGSSETVLTTSLQNNTYHYTAATNEKGWNTPSPAPFTVAGMALNEPVPFTSTSVTAYTVMFTETGLPVGAVWYINITGEPGLFATVSASGGPAIVIALADGSYTFTAASDLKNWTAPGGHVDVSGSNLTVTVAFTSSSSPTSPASSSSPIPWLWISILVIVALLLLLFFIAWRRRKKDDQPPTSSTSPPPSSPPQSGSP